MGDARKMVKRLADEVWELMESAPEVPFAFITLPPSPTHIVMRGDPAELATGIGCYFGDLEDELKAEYYIERLLLEYKTTRAIRQRKDAAEDAIEAAEAAASDD